MRDLVHEINNIEDVSEFRPVWHHLLNASPNASFVQTPEWLETYWSHFGADQKLRVFIIAQDGETRAIVPFVVASADTSLGKLRYLTLPWTFLGIGHRPIGPNPLHALTQAAKHIVRTTRDWDIIDYRCIEPSAPERNKVKHALGHGGLKLTVRAWGEGSLVEFPDGGFDQYWKSRGVMVQENVRRSDEALSQLGQLAFTRFRPSGATDSAQDFDADQPRDANLDADPTSPRVHENAVFDGLTESQIPQTDSSADDFEARWDLFNACEQIEMNSPVELLPADDSKATAIRLFHRDLHAVAARTGNADLAMLSINEQTVGFAYHLIYGSRVEAIRVGFRSDVDATHAGNLLAHQILQDSCFRGDRCYLNCTGSTSWLTDWQTQQFAGYRYTHFSAKAPRAQILRLNPWSSESVS